MLDRGIGIPSPQPEPGALLPATSETRIQLQSALDQLDSAIDVLTKVREHISCIGEDLRLATGDPKRPAGKIDAITAVRLWDIGPAANMEIDVNPRSQSKGEPVARIPFDRLPQEVARPDDRVFFPGKSEGESAQVEIIGGQVIGRLLGRAAYLRGLQSWLDDASDVNRHCPEGRTRLRASRRSGRPKDGRP